MLLLAVAVCTGVVLWSVECVSLLLLPLSNRLRALLMSLGVAKLCEETASGEGQGSCSTVLASLFSAIAWIRAEGHLLHSCTPSRQVSGVRSYLHHVLAS
jgi:hypothetical protein